MIKIVMSTWGTDGDVVPYVALGRRLIDAGYQMRICAADIFRRRVEAAGIDFWPSGPPFDMPGFLALLDRWHRIRDPLALAIAVSRQGILDGAKEWFADCLAGFRGADLALCAAFHVPGQEAALRLGLPLVTANLWPPNLPSAHVPPDGLPNLGRRLNRLIWRLADAKLRQAIDPVYNDFVVSVGGKPRRSYSLDSMYSRLLHFQHVSPLLFPPQPDYPAHHKFTGSWHVAEAPTAVEPLVERFLAAGPPPLVITLGSMGGTQGPKWTQQLLAAVRQTGQRAIVQAGWSGLGAQDGGRDVLFVSWVPHADLFPHARLVVHHGGAGTTHAVCRAGVPSVVVPFMGDQIQWAKALARRGVAPRHLLARDLEPRLLARRIAAALADERMHDRARALGVEMRKEDGTAQTVSWLDALTGARPRLDAEILPESRSAARLA